MKLKERVVMTAMGFSLAVVLLVLSDFNLFIPKTDYVNIHHERVRLGDRKR